jgi:hypothetical protein
VSQSLRRNISSPLRTGFDYQTVWAFRFCFDLLRNPDHYRYLHLETAPEEFPGEESFFLDDILVRRSDDRLGLYQVKITATWSFDELLKQEKDKKGKPKESLIQKWARSFLKCEAEIFEAGLITAGNPDEEMNPFITEDGFLDVAKLKSENFKVFEQIQAQVGTEDDTERFLKRFQFRFNQPDVDALESGTRELFFQELRATASGMTNLLHELHREIRKEHTRPLSVEELRNLCEFDQPKHLNQDFSVPSDFQIFNSDVHAALLSDIEKNSSGAQVFVGSPGAGKSTYLSNLANELRKRELVVIRHHYHLAPGDHQPVERLRADRVIEGIKAQLKDQQKLIGKLAFLNSRCVSVSEFLGELSKGLLKKKKVAVIIIDGLDHAVRHGFEHDLRRALQDICTPQPGIWYLFGLQPAAKSYLPESIVSLRPEAEWVQVPGLDKFAVINLIKKNESGLSLPDNSHSFSEFCERVNEVSQGNPLHLRYTLESLKNSNLGRSVAAIDCDRIPPYTGNIEAYYQTLWRGLSDSAKTALIALSLIDTRLREFNLKELIGTFDPTPALVTSTFNAIRHLLRSDATGLSVFHNSFEEFLRTTPEFGDQKIPTQRALLRWVKSTSDEFIRWAELAKIEYELGNPSLLLSLDYNWLIEALTQARPAHLMVIQLRLASRAALEAMKFSKLLLYSHLAAYLENTIQFNSDAFESAWTLSLYTHTTPIYLHNLDSLSIGQAEALAELAHFQKELGLYDQLFKGLNERHPDQQFGNKGEVSAGRPTLSESLVRVVAIEGQSSLKKVVRYLNSYRESGWSSDLFAEYADALLKHGYSGVIPHLLKAGLEAHEIHAIEKRCILFDLQNSADTFLKHFQKCSLPTPWLALYGVVKGFSAPRVDLPKTSRYPRTIREFDSAKQEEVSQDYAHIFLTALDYAARKDASLTQWRSSFPDRWPFQFISALTRFAETAATKIAAGVEVPIEELFVELKSVSLLRWPMDRDSLGYQRAVGRGLREIIVAVDSINRHYRRRSPLSAARLMKLLRDDLFIPEFFDRKEWLELFQYLDRGTLSGEAIDWYLEWEASLWEDSVVSFGDRSSHFSKLGQLSRKYGRTQKQRHFLHLACRNLISYGHHKDMYLDEVVDALALAAHLDRTKVKGWALQLSPIVQNVREYTDGDETGRIPEYFTELLGEIEPPLAFKYYRHYTEREEFYLANSIFSRLLKFVDPARPIGAAVCATAIDSEPYKSLVALSKSDSRYEGSLKSIHEYVGVLPIDREERGSGSSEYGSKDTEDYTSVSEEDLDRRLKEEVTPWLQSSYLLKWAKKNIESSKLSEEQAVRVLIRQIGRFEDQEIDDHLLDFLYPRVLGINAEESFRFLYLAQRNGNGWSKYWGSNQSDTESRWEFLRTHFPGREDEFYQQSSTYKFDKTKVICPVHRAVDFFIRVDKPERALELLEAAVEFAKLLMADLMLPDEAWYKQPDLECVDLLLDRLGWPSPGVRERAATGLGLLLSSGEVPVTKLLDWISKQELESKIVVGLLPIYKATSTGFKIEESGLLQSIKRFSLAIEKILKNISPGIEIGSDLEAKYAQLRTPPTEFQPSRFFTENIRGFLPPYYFDQASEIANRSGFDFVKDWAFESDQLIDELGVKEELGSAAGYMNDHSEGPIYSFSTKLSEIYKSAFIRVAKHYFDRGRMPDWKYYNLSDKTVPIDLSFWAIAPRKTPSWWPQNIEASVMSDYERGISTFSVDGKLETLPNFDGKIVIGLDGAVKPKEGWQKGISRTRVCLLSFLYEVKGPKLPSAEEIISKIEYLPDFIVPPSTSENTIAYLRNTNCVVLEPEPIEISDIIVHPMLGRVHQEVINIWQWWRGYHSTFSPKSDLGKCVGVESAKDCWEYFGKSKVSIGQSVEWIDGLLERASTSHEAPHGTYYLIDKKYLDSVVQKSRLRMAHVVQFSHRPGADRKREFKTAKETYVYGLSPLIL